MGCGSVFAIGEGRGGEGACAHLDDGLLGAQAALLDLDAQARDGALVVAYRLARRVQLVAQLLHARLERRDLLPILI